MKVITLEHPGGLYLQERSSPDAVGKNEALVRVLQVGICGTDIHAFEGKQPFFSYPRILGHELAVEVLALGDSDSPHSLKVGDLCSVEPYINCQTCAACRRGTSNACMNMQVLGVHRDGGMREMFTVPIRKLHPSKQLSIENLAMVEMLSIGAHAVKRSHIKADETVLVIGAGPIGMGTMLFARQRNAHVIAMDVDPDRLAFCRDKLGIENCIDARQNPLEQLAALTDDLPTTVFDVTGNMQSMTDAFQYVLHGGQLVYVGLINGTITFSDPFFHSHELSLLASRNATSEDFEWVINSLVTGDISLDGWVTHRVTPEELVAQFSGWLLPGSGLRKAVLAF